MTVILITSSYEWRYRNLIAAINMTLHGFCDLETAAYRSQLSLGGTAAPDLSCPK